MSKWDYELPELRAKVANLEQENQVLRNDIIELTKSYYSVLNRVKELTEESDKSGRPHQNIME